LVMALAPIIATVMGWVLLDEVLGGQELLGIGITLAGIAWVILERNSASGTLTPRAYAIGILFAFGGATGQAAGLVTSKIGLEGDFLALSGNLIRLSIATLAIWLFTALRFQAMGSFNRLRENRQAFLLLSGGAITGPVTGVWLSLIAVQLAPVGIASTLIAMTPIFLLPISRMVFKESITPRMILGTLVAFAGTALLFL